MPPEIVKEANYDQKVDIWSTGVIAYVLLTGCPPFYGKNKIDIFVSIVDKTPSFGRVKQHLSQEAIDFTLQCLGKEAGKRPSAEELLQHPWLNENVEDPLIDVEAAQHISDSLATFQKQNAFQTGVVSLITGLKIQQEDLNNLKKIFIKFDTS